MCVISVYAYSPQKRRGRLPKSKAAVNKEDEVSSVTTEDVDISDTDSRVSHGSSRSGARGRRKKKQDVSLETEEGSEKEATQSDLSDGAEAHWPERTNSPKKKGMTKQAEKKKGGRKGKAHTSQKESSDESVSADSDDDVPLHSLIPAKAKGKGRGRSGKAAGKDTPPTHQGKRKTETAKEKSKDVAPSSQNDSLSDDSAAGSYWDESDEETLLKPDRKRKTSKGTKKDDNKTKAPQKEKPKKKGSAGKKTEADVDLSSDEDDMPLKYLPKEEVNDVACTEKL